MGTVFFTRAGTHTRVYAAASDTLNFQARLLGTGGAIAADGNYSIQFNLYNVSSGGATGWTETQTVAVRSGYISVYLGSSTAFPSTIDWSQQQWLTMNVNSDGEMTPRIKLTALPFAFRSAQADSLTNGSSSLTANNLAQLGPSSVQAINLAVAALRLNQTGAGGLIQFQHNGSDVFTVANSGDLTSSGSGTFSGGSLTLGSATQSGGLVLNDGAGKKVTIQSATLGANRTLTAPDESGTICVQNSANCGFVLSGGAGGAFVNNGNSFSGNAILGTNDNFSLSFRTNNTNQITLDTSGNLNLLNGGLQIAGTSVLTSGRALQNLTGINSSGTITFGSLSAGGIVKADTSGNLSVATAGTDYENPLTFNNGLTRSTNTVQLGGLLNQATTIDANSLYSITVTSTLTGARSSYPFVISQANNASNDNSVGLFQLSNSDTGSTAALLNITQVTNGTGIQLVGITSGTGVNANSVTTGTAFSATSITTGNGLTVTGPTTGNGLLVNMTANNASTAKGLSITGAAAGITADYTGALINLNPTRTLTAAATRTDSGNFLNLTRSNTVNNAGATYNVTGALANLQSNCTQTAGTCADSANILSLNQQYANATGTILNVIGSGTGNLAAFDASNASANGVSIDVQSSSSSQYVFKATSNNGVTNGLYVRADGNVGVGNASPAALFSVGSSSQFQVSGTGAVTAVGVNSGTGSIQGTGGLAVTGNSTITGTLGSLTGLTSSGTITFSGLGAGLVQSSSGGVLSSGTVDRNSSTYLSNTLTVANGGTGAGTFTSNGVIYGNGTSALGVTAAGTTGQCLVATTGSAPSWGSCAGAGSGVTLQAAYANGNSITTSDGRDIAFTLADTTTDGNLLVNIASGSTGKFAVQNNGSDILQVTTASGVAITGNTSVASGTFTSSGGVISLNAGSNFATNINTGGSSGTITLGGGSAPLVIDSTHFDVSSAGALSGITSISLSSSISGGTTYSGSGNINTTGGTLQTNSTDRVDNSGNLVNIGNITGTGVVTLSSTGGSNALTLTSGSGTLVLGGSTNTIQRANSALSIDVNNGGSDSTLTVTNSGAGVANLSVEGGITAAGGNFNLNVSGDMTGVMTLLDGSSTANGSSFGSSTSLILTSAANFDVGNYVQVSSSNCGGAGVNPCYAKITAKATNTLTITPALTWANGSNVKEYHIPEIGGVDTSQVLANRYGRGYFIAGVATGNGTTFYNEDSIVTSLANFDLLSGVSGTLSVGVNANAITIGGSSTTTTFAGTVNFTGTVSGIGPSSGTSGYLQRSGTTLSPATAGDNFTTSGNISTTGSGTVTSAGALTVQSGGASITGGLTLATGSLNLTSGGITNAGSIAGATTIGLSGAITGATSGNTINGLIINAGALSGISSIGLSGAITGATSGNTINGLIINSGALSGISTINASGLITGVGLNAGSGLIQNTGGLTSTGSISLNASASTNTTNIATGTTSGQITIGGGSTPLVIDSTNFDVSSAGALSGITTIGLSGAITGATSGNTINGLIINSGALSGISTLNASGLATTVGLNAGSGLIQNTGGITSTGSISLNASASTNTTNIGTGTTSGQVTIGGGSAPLVIDSTNFDVSSAGALSGITTIGLSGAITGATSGNTINGLIINSGALSGVSIINASGLITSVGHNAGTGLIQNTGGLTSTGSISLNASASTNTTNIGTGTTSGQVTIGGGSAPLVIDSTAFDVSSVGALSGITTIGLSGAITGATSTNTINGLVINSGSLSAVTGFTQTSGNFAISGSGTFGTGTGAISLNGATTVTGTNTFTVTGGLASLGAGLSVTGDANISLHSYIPGMTFGATTAQGYFTGSSTTKLGGLQSLDYVGNTYTFFGNNKYFDGTNWQDNGLGRVGASFQIQNDSFTFYSFDTGNTFTSRFSVASGGNVAIGLSGAPGALLSVGGSTGNFQVSSAGAVTAVGLNSGTGLVQGTGGLTISGAAVSLNASSNFNTSLNTGTSTGTITLGGGSTPLVIDSTAFDVSSAGALSGITTINASGLATISGGATISGAAISLNASSNFTVSIGTGTSTGAVTIGGGSNTFTVASTGIDISANAISDANTLTSVNNTNLTLNANGTGNLVFTGYNCTSFNSNGNLTANASGVIACDDDNTGISDARLKKNVVSLDDNILDKIKNIRTVNFDFDCDQTYFTQSNLDCQQSRQTGVIAQELAQVFPELVYQNDDGYYHVKYDALNIYTLKAVTELAAKVDSSSTSTSSANDNGVSTGGTLRLTRDGALQNITGLQMIAGGALIAGGLNNNGGGVTNAGAILGATTVDAESVSIHATGTNNLLTLNKDNSGVFTVFNNGALEIKQDADHAFAVKKANGDDIFSVNTSGGLVQIGGTTADDKTILLVLDSKTTAGDPAGVNGAQYYNANSNKFRCYQNGQWQDCLPAANAEYALVTQQQSWPAMPAADTEFPGQERTWVDLTDARELRMLIGASNNGSTTASCHLQYATTDTGPWNDLSSDSSVDISHSGTLKSDWKAINDAAHKEVLIRVVCSSGASAPLTPAIFNSIKLQVR